MSSEINNKWKEQLIEIDENYGHHNPYIFLKDIENLIKSYYDNEEDYKVKDKLIKNTWYCETLKDYIYFLEKELSNTIKKLKTAEEGFDKRNEILNLPKKNISKYNE
jgi:hypothetical protein